MKNSADTEYHAKPFDAYEEYIARKRSGEATMERMDTSEFPWTVREVEQSSRSAHHMRVTLFLYALGMIVNVVLSLVLFGFTPTALSAMFMWAVVGLFLGGGLLLWLRWLDWTGTTGPHQNHSCPAVLAPPEPWRPKNVAS